MTFLIFAAKVIVSLNLRKEFIKVEDNLSLIFSDDIEAFRNETLLAVRWSYWLLIGPSSVFLHLGFRTVDFVDLVSEIYFLSLSLQIILVVYSILNLFQLKDLKQMLENVESKNFTEFENSMEIFFDFSYFSFIYFIFQRVLIFIYIACLIFYSS